MTTKWNDYSAGRHADEAATSKVFCWLQCRIKSLFRRCFPTVSRRSCGQVCQCVKRYGYLALIHHHRTSSRSNGLGVEIASKKYCTVATRPLQLGKGWQINQLANQSKDFLQGRRLSSGSTAMVYSQRPLLIHRLSAMCHFIEFNDWVFRSDRCAWLSRPKNSPSDHDESSRISD